jgi:hypothetical protein
MNPQLKAALARVDWLRAGHKVLVFCRDLRGDGRPAIVSDGDDTLQKSERLRNTLEGAAEQMLRSAMGEKPK